MKSGLLPGVVTEFTVTVTEDMRPSFDGQVIHDVMSTVSMIHFMELAGRKIILPFLEEGEEGAGFAIDVRHVGPAVVGQEVTFRAICTEVTSKRVVCGVLAGTKWNLVGKGSFTQAIFQKRDMIQRIEELQNRLKAENVP
ncbi:thioesterase family protein [Effusibacillus lacus]|nr:thioesterase [Effusibacillus lacus]